VLSGCRQGSVDVEIAFGSRQQRRSLGPADRGASYDAPSRGDADADAQS
jgi:hypothetical protein